MLLLSTDSLDRYGLNRIFKFVKDAGYDGIDLKITKNFDTQDTEYLKSLIEQYNLPIYAVQAPHNANVKRTKLSFEVAKAVGAKVVVIEPPRILDYTYKSWLIKEIHTIRQKEKLHVCLVNVGDERHLGLVPQYQMTSVPELKRFREVCLDTANVYSRKVDLITFYLSVKSHIVHIFLGNMTPNRRKHTPPHKGVLPLESLLIKLKDDDYKGAITIKVHPTTLQTGSDADLKKRLKEMKDFYEKYYLA